MLPKSLFSLILRVFRLTSFSAAGPRREPSFPCEGSFAPAWGAWFPAGSPEEALEAREDVWDGGDGLPATPGDDGTGLPRSLERILKPRRLCSSSSMSMSAVSRWPLVTPCLLYTSDAADES